MPGGYNNYNHRLVPISGEYHTSPPTYASGDVVPVQVDDEGRLLVVATIASGGDVPVAALNAETIAVNTTATPLAIADPTRTALSITNNGPDPIYYSQDSALVAGDVASAHGAPILLRGQTVYMTVDDPEGAALTTGAWYGIRSSSSTSAIAAVSLGS